MRRRPISTSSAARYSEDHPVCAPWLVDQPVARSAIRLTAVATGSQSRSTTLRSTGSLVTPPAPLAESRFLPPEKSVLLLFLPPLPIDFVRRYQLGLGSRNEITADVFQGDIHFDQWSADLRYKDLHVDFVAGEDRFSETLRREGETEATIAGEFGAEDPCYGDLNQSTRDYDVFGIREAAAGGFGVRLRRPSHLGQTEPGSGVEEPRVDVLPRPVDDCGLWWIAL